jgi:hypothetical protein
MQTLSNRIAFVVLYWWQLLADETIIQNNYALKERDCIAFESAPAERRGKAERSGSQASSIFAPRGSTERSIISI